jgi:hypothetical protein
VFSPWEITIPRCLERLESSFERIYPQDMSGYGPLLISTASFALNVISRSSAPYHNLDHTILATLTGQELLIGKRIEGDTVTPEDWTHYLLALLCHDIGFIRGACKADRLRDCHYSKGRGNEMIGFDCSHTDAQFSPYHVDRSKCFVAEQFEGHSLIDADRIQRYIEMTRFPIPDAPSYQETLSYGGLTRAADLIGQLSDPRYLDKLPDLFAEFEEIGFNQVIGYDSYEDMLLSYPDFYRNVAQPYIRDCLPFLANHTQGQLILTQLRRNIQIAENYLAGRSHDQVLVA